MNARSMEAEARAILEAALAVLEEDMTDLASFARSLFTPIGGVELELPTRESAREPLEFASSPEERPAVSKPRQKADGGTRRR
jgi:plasmid stability protein